MVHDGEDAREARNSIPFDHSTLNPIEFEGSYFSEELSASYHFVVEDEILVSKNHLHSKHSISLNSGPPPRLALPAAT